MIALLAEYRIQVGIVVSLAILLWITARRVRRAAPYLFEPPASVAADADGVTLVEGRRSRRVRWKDVTAVRVRTTAKGPLEEDLFVEVDDATEIGRLRIPAAAEGFGAFLHAAPRYLNGFDMETFAEATTAMDDREFLVWRRG